jgi:type IV secretion system protein VirD4
MEVDMRRDAVILLKLQPLIVPGAAGLALLGLKAWEGAMRIVEAGDWMSRALLGLFVACAIVAALVVIVGWIGFMLKPEVDGIKCRLPWRHRHPGPSQRLFLGSSRGLFGQWVLTFGLEHDSGIRHGRQASGKTGGLAIPEALMWDGPAIIASTKPDVLERTLVRRRNLGPVAVWSPTASGPIADMEPTSYNLLRGCEEPMTAQMRAEEFLDATNAGGGLPEAGFWRDQAAELLASLFHAAAISCGTLADVRRWLATGLDEPTATVAGGPEATWQHDLLALTKLPDRTRDGIVVTARTALKPIRVSTVRDRCCTGAFDIDAFLLGRGTLYLAGSLEHQFEARALTVLLVDAILARALELHQAGRLSRRLLVQLDELPAICPLPKLRTWLSQGAQQGLTFSLFLQNWALMEEVYGETGAAAIFEGCAVKQLFGGSMDIDLLNLVSTIVGTHEVERQAEASNGTTTTTKHREPILSPDKIARLRPFRVLTLLPRPFFLETRKLESVAEFRRLMDPATVAPPLMTTSPALRAARPGWRRPGPESAPAPALLAESDEPKPD